MIEHIRTTCPNTPSPMRPAAYIADMLMEIALQFEAAHFSQIRGQNLMTFPASSSIYSTNTRSTETRLSERRTRKPIDRCPAHWPRAWRAFLRSLIVATDASCFLALCSQSVSFVRPRRWLSSVPTTAVPWSVGGQAGGDNVDKFNLQLREFHTGGFCPLVEAQITARLPNLRERQRRFFLTIVDAQLDFERDAGGKVVDVVVHQNGRDIRATGVTRQE
jgi:hypothetical protein